MALQLPQKCPGWKLVTVHSGLGPTFLYSLRTLLQGWVLGLGTQVTVD